MRMYDLIIKKRNNLEHTKEEIEYIVDSFTNGDIPDYQMSAWLMSVFFNGMTREETVNLTMAMAASGDRLDLSAIEGTKVDKHSTGGVGDKTTFVVAPILASLGVPIAKMSGRGLGHTGGTIDKLESIPGFNTSISEKEFIDNVNNIKLSLVGQTGNLAPADKKIYALRDVTATVDSLPLIASSIMSKKLASGADAIVLDVKCGSGAFMKNYDDAYALARTMTDIGNMSGRKTYALITDMNEPLGCKVGNSLEVIEAIEVLSGKTKGLGKLIDISLTLASYMLLASGTETSIEKAMLMCKSSIDSGEALNKLAEFVHAQGGNRDYIYNVELFDKAPYIIPVKLGKRGYISACNTNEVGMVSLILGGGRLTKNDKVNPCVGIDIRKHIGDYVEEEEIFAYIHAMDMNIIDEASNRLINAYTVSKESVNVPKAILGKYE